MDEETSVMKDIMNKNVPIWGYNPPLGAVLLISGLVMFFIILPFLALVDVWPGFLLLGVIIAVLLMSCVRYVK